MTVAERPAWVDDELFPFESRLDGAGHLVQSDAADRSAAAIRDWHKPTEA